MGSPDSNESPAVVQVSEADLELVVSMCSGFCARCCSHGCDAAIAADEGVALARYVFYCIEQRAPEDQGNQGGIALTSSLVAWKRLQNTSMESSSCASCYNLFLVHNLQVLMLTMSNAVESHSMSVSSASNTNHPRNTEPPMADVCTTELVICGMALLGLDGNNSSRRLGVSETTIFGHAGQEHIILHTLCKSCQG